MQNVKLLFSSLLMVMFTSVVIAQDRNPVSTVVTDLETGISVQIDRTERGSKLTNLSTGESYEVVKDHTNIDDATFTELMRFKRLDSERRKAGSETKMDTNKKIVDHDNIMKALDYDTFSFPYNSKRMANFGTVKGNKITIIIQQTVNARNLVVDLWRDVKWSPWNEHITYRNYKDNYDQQYQYYHISKQGEYFIVINKDPYWVNTWTAGKVWYNYYGG